MIESIRGRLETITAEGAIVEVGGLGLLACVPGGDRARLGALLDGTGAPPAVRLFTHLVVRPESWQLYGFLEKGARDLFRVLLDIQGVGPRMALALVSRLSLEQIQEAVAARDPSAFKAVPGIGLRTAERILLELSGKLRKRLDEAPAAARVPALRDAVDALVALGLAQPEADRLVREAAAEPEAGRDASSLVASALRRRREPRARA